MPSRFRSRVTRLAGGPAPFLAAWLTVPFLAGPIVAAALEEVSAAVTWLVSLAAWAGWALTMLTFALPRPVGLTAVRVVVPVGVPLAGWAAALADSVPWSAAGLAVTSIAALAVFSPGVGDHFVDGASYGNERRFALAPPAALVAGPLPAGWLVTVAGAVTGPLLLSVGQWVAGASLSAVGALLARAGFVRLHQLSLRWLVLVPAGVVIHDLLALDQPVLLPRGTIRRLGPALTDSGCLDLTGGALGLVLELSLAEPGTFGVRSGRAGVTEVEADCVRVAPTLRAAVLDTARQRRITVAERP